MTPDQEHPIDPQDIPAEVVRNRARVRNINDTVQNQRIQIAVHGEMLRVVEGRIDALQDSMVSREGLEAAMQTINLKIDTLHADLTPIKHALYWVACLIVGAVILALISGLVRNPITRPPTAVGIVQP